MHPTKTYIDNAAFVLGQVSDSVCKSDVFFRECDDFMKKLSYHTIEYGFSIDKLTAQFLSKTVDISPSKHFESCIAQSLGLIKNCVMELADKIKERINQYYSATHSVTHSSVAPLLLQCQQLLADLEKQVALREHVCLRIEASSKDLLELQGKTEVARAKGATPKELKKLQDKLGELRLRREKECKTVFDAATAKSNQKLDEFAKCFQACLQHVRQYESARNGVVIIGFDKLTALFSDWAARTSQVPFVSISDKMTTFSLVERGLEGIPTSWLPRAFCVPSFEDFTAKLDALKPSKATSTFEADLRSRLDALKQALPRADTIKADLYCLHLTAPVMTDLEEAMLDDQVSMKLADDAFISYLLAIINMHFLATGKNQFKVSKKHFISLKNKFLTILSKLDAFEIQMNHAGQLLYNAARIYYEDSENSNEMVHLIVHLDCGIMRQSAVWEHYFLFRIDRKLIQLDHTDSVKEILSPIKKMGDNSYKFSEAHKQVIKFIENNPELVAGTLKEIVYYLTLVQGIAPKARNILVKIFTKYKIDKKLVSQILFLERRYNEAYVNSKIQTIQSAKKIALQTPTQRLAFIFKKCLPFLADSSDLVKLTALSRPLRMGLREKCLKQILSRDSLSRQERVEVYRMVIPKRFKASDFSQSKDAVPINPSCSRIIKLDLDRTCRLRPDLYRKTELLLFNYLHRNDSKMCYFQGLNFIALHIVELFAQEVDQLNCIEHVITNIFGEFINSKIFKDGLGMFIMFYCLDRIFEMQAKKYYAHMQREGIGVQLFAANPIITLFTWNNDVGVADTRLSRIVWDSIILHPSVSTLFKIVLGLFWPFREYLLLCDMEDFIVTWDTFMTSKSAWNFEPMTQEKLLDRVHSSKVDTLDFAAISAELSRLRERIEEIPVSADLVSVLFEEYYTLNQNIHNITREVNQQILQESEMSLHKARPPNGH